MKHDVVAYYLKRVRTIFSGGNAREESYYECLAALFEKMWKFYKIGIPTTVIMPPKTEGGNPDMLLKDNNNMVVGYIEAKALFKDLDTLETSEQIQRYLAVFPNFILTNFLEFRLYRRGQRMLQATLVSRDVLVGTEGKIRPPEPRYFLALIREFFSFTMPACISVKELAEELARRTRYMRDHVAQEILAQEPTPENDKISHIHGLYEAFQTYLIHGLSKMEFADLYAQTLTFGLFTAATQKQFALDPQYVFHYIPPTNGILRDIFQFIAMGHIPRGLKCCLDDIIAVIAAANPAEILHSYFNEGKGTDPVLHFYETFLNAYDPTVREKKGVYYTPVPVVHYIVHSLDILLKTRLHKPDGLADREINILDPASGTSTFLAVTAERVAHTYEQKYGTGAKASLMRQYLLHNLYGFEEMMAPYAVGHLKMLYILESLGIQDPEPPRFNLYLTNTLEMENIEQSNLPGMSSLSKESYQAGKIKKETPITVILGNPPYSGHSANPSATGTLAKKDGTGSTMKDKTWIGAQIEHYKRVNGARLEEKNAKWLQDDYVKFIRFAQYKIESNGLGEGVVGFITNHAYLDNPTFRGMRQSLMGSFNEIYILDLHGNVSKKEKCPDGSVDENIFDIRQGTAIAFFIKAKGLSVPCRVFYAQVQGSRVDKFAYLNSQNIDTTQWQEIHPEPEFYLFTPRGEMNRQRYATFFKITEIFPVHSVAIITARDTLTIDSNRETLYARVQAFAAANEEEARQTFHLGEDTRDWGVKPAQNDLRDSGPDSSYVAPILYRPFDWRYTYYTGKSRGFLCMPRPEVMRHMLQENLGLITVRQVAEGTFNHCLVTNTLTESRVTTSNKGIAYLFPLYLYLYPHHHPIKGKRNLFTHLHYAAGVPSPREANVAPHILRWFTESARFPVTPEPEQIFYYIYAILFSPLYRETYAEGLKIDFPRVPFTAQHPIFIGLSRLGEELVALHLLKSPALGDTLCKYEGKGKNEVKTIEYQPETQQLFINKKQYFSHIAPSLWEYHWNGYKVLFKWLKDRRGLELSGEDILHVIKMVHSIHLTMQCQQEIDVLFRELEEETTD